MSTAALPATDAGSDFDPGPLSWVHAEIDGALERGLEALAAFEADPADATSLKRARNHVHQAAGAIRMVGLDAVVVFVEEIERQLARLEELSSLEVSSAIAPVDRACRKLRIFLDETVNGVVAVPLRLFPEYEAMQRSRGVAVVSAADLFYPDLTPQAPLRSQQPAPTAGMPAFLLNQRRHFQRGLLVWLRGDDEGARVMRESVDGIEQASSANALRSFWWTTGALFEALAERGLEVSLGVKQLAARIDLQIRRVAEGSVKVADRLRREVLYYVAISAPVAPAVGTVQRRFGLARLIPSPETMQADVVRLLPLLRAVRDELGQAKDAWIKFASGRAEDLARLRAALATVRGHAESIGNPALDRLAADLERRLSGMTAGRVSEALAMEYATALLLADSATEHHGNVPASFPAQVDAMLRRLDAAQSSRPLDAEAAVPLLDEMSKRAQERLLVAHVCREIRVNLRHMEQVLDAFFRDHHRRVELASLRKDTAQIRGALRMLGLETADALLASCQEQIESYADPTAEVSNEDLELLAEALAGIGFFVEAIEQQRSDADRIIAPLLARRRGETSPATESAGESVEASVTALRSALPELVAEVRNAPADVEARDALKAKLAVLRDDAELIGDAGLVAQARAAMRELEQGGSPGDALESLAEQSSPAPAPEVSAEAQRLLETHAQKLDQELLEIFLAEAEEVLDTINEHRRILGLNPGDREALRTVRRQFHTLKGSGRMVGLTELAEVAYDVEKIHNRLLEDERTVSPAVLRMIEEAGASFRRWVAELRDAGRVVPDPEQVHAAILAVEAEWPRGRESVLRNRAAVAPTAVPAASEPSVAAPEAPGQVASDGAAGTLPGGTPSDSAPDRASDSGATTPAAASHDDSGRVPGDIGEAAFDHEPTVGGQAGEPLPEEAAAENPAAEETTDEPATLEGALPESPDAAITPFGSDAASLSLLPALASTQWFEQVEMAIAPADVPESTAPGDIAVGPEETAEAVSEAEELPLDSWMDAAATSQLDDLDTGVMLEDPEGIEVLEVVAGEVIDVRTGAPAFGEAPPLIDRAAGHDAAAAALSTPAEDESAPPPEAFEALLREVELPSFAALPEGELRVISTIPAVVQPDADHPASDDPCEVAAMADAVDQPRLDRGEDQRASEALPVDAEGVDSRHEQPTSASATLDEAVDASEAREVPTVDPVDAASPVAADAPGDLPAGPEPDSRLDALPDADSTAADDVEMAAGGVDRPVGAGAATEDDPALAPRRSLRASHLSLVVGGAEGARPHPAHATTAQHADVDLAREMTLDDALAEEELDIGGVTVSRALHGILVAEAEEHLAVLARELGVLQADRQYVPSAEMVRASHTLCGIHRTAGFAPLAVLAKALELCVLALQERGQPVRPDEHPPLARGVHGLAALVMAVKSEQPFSEAERLLAQQAQADLDDLRRRIAASLAGAPEAQDEEAADAALPSGVEADDSAEPVGVADELESVALPAVDTQSSQPVAEVVAETDLHGIVDELDEQLLPIFLEEADELFPQAGEQLRAWRRQPEAMESAQGLRRTLHTIKGSARMAGAMRLGEITHRMESRLLVGDVPAAGSPELFDALETDLDRLALVLDALRTGRTDVDIEALITQAPEPPRTVPVATDALDIPDAATASGGDGVAGRSVTAVVAGEAATNAPDAEGAQRSMLRVRADVIDRLVNEAGEVAIARARVEGELRVLKANLVELSNSVARMRTQVREIEIQAESRIQSHLGSMQEKHTDFDPLELDRYTRFQELTRSLAESINDVATVQQALLRNCDAADTALVAQARLSRDVQQQLFAIRTVPFSSLSERLYRIVRQVSKELDKRVNLDIRGGQVELDRSVLERLAGPLEHLLRNALDHGIESKEARAATSKPATAEIAVSVRQVGNEIAIDLADDGAGLDLARIHARAVAQGRFAPGTQPTEAELVQCIFAAGFSTAARVTAVSGRGIGMDVVRSEIASLGGRVEVTTRAGLGTTFHLYLPLTLAVAQAVLVRAGGRLWALPAPMVEQVQQVRIEALRELYNERRQLVGAVTYPFSYLPRLLGDTQAVPVTGRQNPVLLLRTGQGVAAIHVDEMLGNQEVVVKNIGPQLSRVTGIAGATVLGSGEIVLIINPVQLVQRGVVRGYENSGEERVVQSTTPVPDGATKPLVLVVDDSLTVRKMTTRFLTREGFDVVTAKDGMEALQRLEEQLADVVLLDVEMPRMDGFEFTKAAKASERFANVPIIMITSRTAEKHRNRARDLGVDLFLGKPYQEDELLGHLREMLSLAVG